MGIFLVLWYVWNPLICSKMGNTWTTLVFLPHPPVEIAKHTAAQRTTPYASHITEIHCDFSEHQRKAFTHLLRTNTEGAVVKGLKDQVLL